MTLENQLHMGGFPWAKDFAFGRLKVSRKSFFSVLENRLAMNPQIQISTMRRKSAHLKIYSFSDSKITQVTSHLKQRPPQYLELFYISHEKSQTTDLQCKHCKCGQPQGVAHTAFKYPELMVQRQSLIASLDAERANMAQDSA